MQLFYLHVSDGDELIRDPEGAYFPDLDAARAEAIHSARELMAESIASEGRIGMQRCMVVSNTLGVRLIVPFRETVAM
jgi:hypothetical protein